MLSNRSTLEVLAKPIDKINVDDINALIDERVPEGERIEFKEGLSTKGRTTDPWMTGGNHIGEVAKKKILMESVAFANAFGGAVVLGVEESKWKPAVAKGISPIPRCQDLADRLKLIFRDCVEPELPRLEILAVPTAGTNGIVLIRAAASRLAPHRVTNTKECPIRRMDRCEVMSMREIQDMTLNLNRGLHKLEEELAVRSERFLGEIVRLATPESFLGIRVTAVPIVERIETERVFRDGQIIDACSMPWTNASRSFGSHKTKLKKLVPSRPSNWRPIVRGARGEHRTGRINESFVLYGEMYTHGLVEIGFVSCTGTFQKHGFTPDWPLFLLLNAALWADRVRTYGRAPSVEYAIDVQLYKKGKPVSLSRASSKDVDCNGQTLIRNQVFPRYSLGDIGAVVRILSLFELDLWHSVREDIDLNGISYEVSKS